MSDLTQAEIWSCIQADAARQFPNSVTAIVDFLATKNGESLLRHYHEAGEGHNAPPVSPRLASENPALARLERLGREIARKEGISEAAGLAKASIANKSLYDDYRQEAQRQQQRQRQRLIAEKQRELVRRGLAG